MERQGSTSIIFLLMFTISGILITLNIMEINQVIKTWDREIIRHSLLFHTCIKWDIINRFAICIFTFCIGLSTLILCIMLMININYFIEKLVSTYIYFNYLLFGPILLGFSVLALLNWHTIFYECVGMSNGIKRISYSNIMYIIVSSIISSIITFLWAANNGINTMIDSTTQKAEGNKVIRNLFWYLVFKIRKPEDLMRESSL